MDYRRIDGLRPMVSNRHRTSGWPRPGNRRFRVTDFTLVKIPEIYDPVTNKWTCSERREPND